MLSAMFPAEAILFLVTILAYAVTMKTREFLAMDDAQAKRLKGNVRFLSFVGHVAAISMLVWAFMNFGWLAVLITFFVAQLAAALVAIGFVVPLKKSKNYSTLFTILVAGHTVVTLAAATGWAWYFLTK